ncbi:hypothetical protein [Mobiluncus curtisii]|uniref:hypothetical protein n=1 Tax=Mobiluncus curtisii TaxID=2051 RepID=UPI0001E09504|nr:hypothetical protein [Mobiluncus curtisii]EFL94025.1 hypothetical protein HMPREF0574_0626 [Mobiluncus curtisii subsp. curtisii ATCC 35241]QQT12908.1 hypothetical protein I6I84_07260 [Mobiluncus curtisii]STY77506.1 Uncharacterised protein [Mobiluncus curtisii subsp. curtisii]
MTPTQLRAETTTALALARLDNLTRSGVLTPAQAASVATRIAADAGAEIGALKAQTLVDFAVDQSDV